MNNRVNLIAVLVLLLNIIIVWLPVQFQTTAIQEEWRIRARYDGNIDTFNDIGKKTDEIFQSRPFGGVINQVAYFFTPDSFISHHIIIILSLIAKGFALFLLIKYLFPNHILWAYFCATLLIMYPSDPGIVSLRIPHYHLTITLILLSIYYLVRYYRESQWVYVLFFGLAQLIAGLTLEIGYPIFLFAPLILIILERRISKRVVISTILFYTIPFITVIYSYVLLVFLEVSFQSTAFVQFTIREHLRNVYNLYVHNFFTAWQNVFQYLTTQATTTDYVIFLATSITTLIGSLALMRQVKQSTHHQPIRIKVLITLTVSLLVVLLGYAIYLPSRTHTATDYRVYLLSSVGAATFFSTLVYILYSLSSRYPIRYLVLLGFSIVVGLTGVFANKTHTEYLMISQQQERFAKDITTAVPAFNDTAYIVIKMPSNGNYLRLSLGEIDKPVLFTPMLQYIYNDYEHLAGAIICFTDYLSCIFNENSMDTKDSNFINIDTPIPYENLILFDTDKQGNLTLIEQDETLPGYDPIRLINVDAPPPRRIQTLYGDSE